VRTRHLFAVLAVGAASLFAVPTAAANHITYSPGEVFAAGGGTIDRFLPDGTPVETLPQGQTGMCFDAAGNMYATYFGANKMVKYDNKGAIIQDPFGSGFNADPESCVRDGAGNFYVGQADGTGDVLKFDSSGNPLGSFDVATGPRGTDWIDLAADQCTLFYNSEGPIMRRFNVCTNTQLADFANTAGCLGVGMRIHPNGDVFTACFDDTIRRLDSTGAVVQSYPIAGASNLFAFNLDPDGTTFWTADFSGTIYRVNITSGAIVKQFTRGAGVEGLAIFGEVTAAVEGPPGSATCSDGIDNDKDGKIDLADPDCQGGPPAGCRISGVGGYTDTFNPSLVVRKGDSLSSDTSKPIAPPNSSAAQKLHLAWGPPRDPTQHVFRMTKLSKATCIDTPGVDPGQGQTIDTFLAEGEGTVDGVPGFNFVARLIDKGEPGTGNDTVHVKITKQSDGSLFFTTKGTLSSGNQDSKDGS
jgi:hypothetical protein